MNTTSTIQLISLIFLLLLSAFFSSAETAFTTANKIRLRTLAESGNAKARRVLAITNDMQKLLSAILIGNNIVNLSASSIATTLAIKLFGSVGAGIATGVLTLLILIFGEISPKTIATINADELSLAYSGIIYGLMCILTPVIYVVNRLSLGFLRLLHIDPSKDNIPMTEEEFKTIVDVGHETGVIENSEHEMINNMFDFGDSEAKEVMIPRIDMTFANVESTYEELIDIFREDKFTRIPIYEENTDNVIGIINIKDLLLCENRDDFSLRSIMREPFYTYEHKNTAELFIEMRKSSINFAIVLDEYGATAGMITLEDLLEEIVGEIRDEYDMDEEDDLIRLTEREYLIQGSMNLDDLSEDLDLPFTSDDYDTIGGYVVGLLDHLPEENEIVITDENILLRVDKMDKNRIEKIYMRLPEGYHEKMDEE